MFFALFIFITAPLCGLGVLKCLEILRRVRKYGWKRETELLGKHVVITGGSSGIGLCVATELARRGANVSIVARSKPKLEEAKKEIEKHVVFRDKQKVCQSSCDIANGSTTEIENSIQNLVDLQGPVFMLVNCAGMSIPSKLDDLAMDQIRRQMDINFFGSANVTKAVLPAMKSSGNGGIIVFVSSLAGLVGLYGFTGYSASKFAVRGFAEALAMEVLPFGISVTVNCPPDTDTPGLKEEDKYKPEETRLISQSAGLLQPETVARSLVEDALNEKFLSSTGLDGFMLTNLCSGMGPSSVLGVLVQSLLGGIFRLIAWGHVQYFNWIVKKCHLRKSDKKLN